MLRVFKLKLFNLLIKAIDMKKFFLSLSSLALTTLSFAQPAMLGAPVNPRPESEALAQSMAQSNEDIQGIFRKSIISTTQLNRAFNSLSATNLKGWNWSDIVLNANKNIYLCDPQLLE